MAPFPENGGHPSAFFVEKLEARLEILVGNWLVLSGHRRVLNDGKRARRTALSPAKVETWQLKLAVVFQAGRIPSAGPIPVLGRRQRGAATRLLLRNVMKEGSPSGGR